MILLEDFIKFWMYVYMVKLNSRHFYLIGDPFNSVQKNVSRYFLIILKNQ